MNRAFWDFPVHARRGYKNEESSPRSGSPFVNTGSDVEATSESQTSGDEIRADRDQLAARQKRLAELLNCPPEKIEHEVRNLLNELRLLRTLFESQEQKD
jgi:hypothetical protein